MSEVERRKSKERTYLVFMNGTWEESLPIDAHSAHGAFKEALSDMRQLFGKEFLSFSEAKVYDEGAVELLYSWSNQGPGEKLCVSFQPVGEEADSDPPAPREGWVSTRAWIQMGAERRATVIEIPRKVYEAAVHGSKDPSNARIRHWLDSQVRDWWHNNLVWGWSSCEPHEGEGPSDFPETEGLTVSVDLPRPNDLPLQHLGDSSGDEQSELPF